MRSWLFMIVAVMTNIGPPEPKIWLRPSLRGPLFDELGRPVGGPHFAKVRPNLLPKMASHTHKRENFSAVRTSHSEALAEVLPSWLFENVAYMTNIGAPGLKIWLWPSIRCPDSD